METSKYDHLLEKLVLGEILFGHYKSQLGKLKESLVKNANPLVVLKNNSLQSQIRLSSFQSFLKLPALRTQLIESNFLEVLVREYLFDKKSIVNYQNSEFFEFLPVQELFPVRYEAITMIFMVLENKLEYSEVVENLILQIKAYKVLDNELQNLMDDNELVCLSALEFLENLILLAENEFAGLFNEASAGKILKKVFEKKSLYKEKYLRLEKYSNN